MMEVNDTPYNLIMIIEVNAVHDENGGNAAPDDDDGGNAAHDDDDGR